MELGNIKKDIDDIAIKGYTTLNTFYIEAILHLEEEDIKIEYIEYYDIVKDYVTSLCDSVTITFNIGAGTLINEIYPNRDNLEMTIKTESIDGSGELVETETRYKCIITDIHKAMQNPMFTSTDRDTQDKSLVLPLTAECSPREFEVLKNVYTFLNIRNATVKDSIYAAFYKIKEKGCFQVEDQEVELTFSVVEPDNKIEYSSITCFVDFDKGAIPILDYPSYIQHKLGVYNGSIGTYLCKEEDENIIYVYPLLDYNSYDKEIEGNKLMVFVPNRFEDGDFAENTYYEDGSVLKILTTTDINGLDRGEDELRNVGNTVSSVHPKSLINRQTTKKEGEDVTYDKNEISRTNDYAEMKDGTVNVKVEGVTGNMYESRSKIIAADMIYYDLTWTNGNPNIITPGMPVQLLFENIGEDKIKTYTGRVHTVVGSYSAMKKMFMVKLVICVRKDPEEEE